MAGGSSVSSLSDGLSLRDLALSDFHKGYLDLLSQLTVVGTISEAEFEAQVSDILKNPDQHVVVVEDTARGQIVATGTLLIEKKILRHCGKVGHVEDVVVDASVRGKHVGQRVIEELNRLAKEAGCYKVILDCNEGNVAFYEKCGYKKKEIQMALYFN